MVSSASNLSDVTAVILAGGQGTRLRSVVDGKQKVIASVGGRPFLEYIFDELIAAGVKNTILCTGYHSEQLEELFGERYKNLSIIHSREPTPLGTAGAIRNSMQHISSKTAIVLNGDSIVKFDLNSFYGFHRDSAAKVSMALFEAKDATRYGSVKLDLTTCRVEEFAEKKSTTEKAWINAGVYLIEKDLLNNIPPSKVVSLEKDIFPEWVSKEQFFGFPVTDGLFIDIGTPESYGEANRIFSGGRA